MHVNAAVTSKESNKAITDNHLQAYDEELKGENYMFSSLEFQMFANVTWHEIITDSSISSIQWTFLLKICAVQT